MPPQNGKDFIWVQKVYAHSLFAILYNYMLLWL